MLKQMRVQGVGGSWIMTWSRRCRSKIRGSRTMEVGAKVGAAKAAGLGDGAAGAGAVRELVGMRDHLMGMYEARTTQQTHLRTTTNLMPNLPAPSLAQKLRNTKTPHDR